MDALTQQLMQQLSGGGGVSRISQQIGAEEQTTQSALTAVMPVLVSALANNASKPDGAQALYRALEEDHDGSILNDMPGYLREPQTADGAGILRHVLGSKQPVVAQGVAQKTGLSSDQVAQLLQIAAPLIMGLLGQQQRQKGLDTDSLSAFLGSQRRMDEQSNPDLIGMLNSVLDTNRSGSFLDEIFGRLFGRR